MYASSANDIPSPPPGTIQDPNAFSLPANRAGTFSPPSGPLQPLPQAQSYQATVQGKRSSALVPPDGTQTLHYRASAQVPNPSYSPAGPSGRAANLYRIPEQEGTFEFNPSSYAAQPGPYPSQPDSLTTQQASLTATGPPGVVTDPKLKTPDAIFVDRSMMARVFVVYLVLACEILFEAFAGTHIGGTQAAGSRRVTIAATSGIQMGIHLILLVAFVAAFKDMLYVRLAMYDLFLREFRWFFLSWAMSMVVVGIVRGYRVYNTFGNATTNIDAEWGKPGLYPAFIVERVFQLAYFCCAAAALQLGMQQRLYTRECLDAIWSARFG